MSATSAKPKSLRTSPATTKREAEADHNLLDNTQFLAAFRIAAATKHLGGLDRLAVDLFIDDLRLEVVSRDECRREQLRRGVEQRRLRLGRLPRQQLHRDVRRGRGDDLAGLVDGVVLVARDDQLQTGDGRIVAGDRRHRIDACRLEGGDRRAAGAVIGGHHADDLLAETGDLTARPLLRLRRRPVRRVVFGQRRVAAAGQAFMDTVPDQPGGGIGRRAIDLQHPGVGGRDAGRLQPIDQRLGDGLADRLVVEGDVEIRRRRRDRAVIGDDLHALALGLLDQRRRRRGIDGVDDDHLRALGDHGIELLLLARRVRVGVLVEHLAGGAQLAHLGDETRVIVLLVACRRLVRHQKGHRGPRDAGTFTKSRSCAQQRQCQRRPADRLQRKYRHWSSPLDHF